MNRPEQGTVIPHHTTLRTCVLYFIRSIFRNLYPYEVETTNVSKFKYSARSLMGSRIIESPACCNQISRAQVYINRAQNTSVN
jgi:hypothetical protein